MHKDPDNEWETQMFSCNLMRTMSWTHLQIIFYVTSYCNCFWGQTSAFYKNTSMYHFLERQGIVFQGEAVSAAETPEYSVSHCHFQSSGRNSDNKFDGDSWSHICRTQQGKKVWKSKRSLVSKMYSIWFQWQLWCSTPYHDSRQQDARPGLWGLYMPGSSWVYYAGDTRTPPPLTGNSTVCQSGVDSASHPFQWTPPL